MDPEGKYTVWIEDGSESQQILLNYVKRPKREGKASFCTDVDKSAVIHLYYRTTVRCLANLSFDPSNFGLHIFRIGPATMAAGMCLGDYIGWKLIQWVPPRVWLCI